VQIRRRDSKMNFVVGDYVSNLGEKKNWERERTVWCARNPMHEDHDFQGCLQRGPRGGRNGERQTNKADPTHQVMRPSNHPTSTKPRVPNKWGREISRDQTSKWTPKKKKQKKKRKKKKKKKTPPKKKKNQHQRKNTPGVRRAPLHPNGRDRLSFLVEMPRGGISTPRGSANVLHRFPGNTTSGPGGKLFFPSPGTYGDRKGIFWAWGDSRHNSPCGMRNKRCNLRSQS